MKTIGVVGAGIMGTGTAQTAVVTNYRVVLRDIKMELVSVPMNRMDQYSTKSVAEGRMTAKQKEEASGWLTKTNQLQGLEEADLVIEAALENMGLKKDVFQELNQTYKKETIFAPNISSMSITEIGKESECPDWFCRIHFFDPVPVVRLIEATHGLSMSDKAVETMLYFALSLGKTPVEVKKDSPGFIVNRLLLPYLSETAKTSSEGVAAAEGTDIVVRLGLNYSVGPFQMINSGGVRLAVDILNCFKEGFNNNSYVPQPLSRQVVRAGKLGPRAGEDFYKYE